MDSDKMKQKISRSVFKYLTERSGQGMFTEVMAVLPYENNDIKQALEDLTTAKFIQHSGRFNFGPGINYEEWEEMMSPKEAAVQNFNINNINGPTNVGGQGDINITINNGDAEALVALIRELSKPNPSKGVINTVKGILSAGKDGLGILKDLALAGSKFLPGA